tara:strand:+ start:436 stop:1536 length:1101 start_codon:yes stop_codon:yes gene_type:complete
MQKGHNQRVPMLAPNAMSTDMTPGELWKVGTGTKSDWVATIVNPSANGGTTQQVLFWFHILVWVVALGLSCTVNFGAVFFIGEHVDPYVDRPAAPPSSPVPTSESGEAPPSPPPPDFTGGLSGHNAMAIGILGGVSSILGVLVLLYCAAMLDTEEYKTKPLLNAVLQLLTLFGSVASVFIFAEASRNSGTAIFWVALFGVLFLGYAQVLLYCTSAALGVPKLEKAFIPALAFSVQLILALAISDGTFRCVHTDHIHGHGTDFGNLSYENCTEWQIASAWIAPGTTVLALALFVLRSEKPSAMLNAYIEKTSTFYKSLFLFLLLSGGVLSIYILSFVQPAFSPTAYMFALSAMLTQFAIIITAFSYA